MLAPLGKGKWSGDLSLLPPRISEIPRFFLRTKSLHLLSKFSPPEVIRLQLSMPLLSPQGKHDRHGTPHHFFHRPASFPRDNITSTLCNEAVVSLHNTIMLTSCVRASNTLRRQSAVSRRLAIVGFLQGLTASKSVRKPRTFCVGCGMYMFFSTSMCLGRISLL